jgi:type IV secretion system protein TrbL
VSPAPKPTPPPAAGAAPSGPPPPSGQPAPPVSATAPRAARAAAAAAVPRAAAAAPRAVPAAAAPSAAAHAAAAAHTLAARAARVAATFAPRRRHLCLVPLLFAVLLLASAAAAHGQPGSPDGILDGIVRDYQDVSGSWFERIQPLAQRTFALLATLELAVSGLFWALGREGLDAIAVSLLRKFIVLAFLFSLLSLFPLWIPAIIGGFSAAGQAASATTVVNPSAVLDLGGTIAGHMLLSFGALGFLVNPVGVLLASFTAFFVVIAFGLIAAQLVLTLIESYLVVSGGALFLGFAGSRFTAPLAEGYLAYAFEVGARIYLLYLLMGVGTGFARQWAMLDFSPGFDLAPPPTLIAHFQVMCGAIIFCLLVWIVPRTLAGRLVRGITFHLRLADALR